MHDMEAIISAQRHFFATGVTKDVGYRLAALENLQAGIRENEAKLLSALQEDLNKTPFEGYMTEIGMVLDDLGFAIRHLPAWAKPRRVKTPLAQFAARSFVLSEPYGVALILSPWNYPFQLSLEPLTGAIAAGNTAVIKPSAYAPATSRAVAELIKGLFPPVYITVVEGGRAQNEALLEQRFDYIFFTGSVAVGRLVMEKAARHLTPISLELGGKSPCIVDKTAKLPLAAKRIAFGKFLNAGQTCVAPDYLLVEECVKAPLLQEIEKAIKAFFPNGYADMPVIINDKHFARLMDLIEGTPATKFGSAEPARRFIPPTLVDGVTWDSPVMQEEIFGPILPVMTFTALDDAIEAVRAREKPLALYLFTTSRKNQDAVLGRVSFGGGCVNDTIIHLATPHMGFGGVGSSGMGSYHGKLSFDTFTHYKSIVDKKNFIDLPMRYHPYTESNFKLLRLFLK